MNNSEQFELIKKGIYVPEKSIDEIEKKFGGEIPSITKCILQNADDLMSNNGVVIYNKDDIFERNMTWDVSTYAKGYIAIGDDSGGNIFMMELSSDAMSVYLTNVGTLDMKTAKLVTTDIQEWISSGFALAEEEDGVEFCHIDIVQMPSNGFKGLIEVKKSFCPSMSSSEVLNASKQLPWRCVSNYPYWKAKKQLQKLGDIGNCIKLVIQI